MPWIRLNNFEYAGYVSDVDAHLLPPNVVSQLANAHCLDGVLARYRGYQTRQVLTNPAFWLLPGGFGTPWLLAAGEDTVVSLSDTGETNVSPLTTLTPVEMNAWTGGVLHGIGVLNNGTDKPQYWTGTGEVADLPNWVSGETCKVLRPFKNFLFAGNITDNGGSYPTKVKWSNQADPGSAPSSWDETDPSEDTGTNTLSDTPGEVLDFQQSGDSLFAYKEDAVYEITYIGGVYIFKFAPRFYQFGLMGRNCSFSYRGVNYAFGTDDIVAHTSTEMQSIVSKVLRRRIFGGLAATYRKRSFVAFDPANGDILFCVPWGSDKPDYAFTYNPTTKKWGERNLPQVGHLATGKTVFDPGGDWDSDSGSWDSDTTSWGEVIALDAKPYMAGDALYALNDTETFEGTGIPVVMERKSLDFGAEQQPNERIKFVSRVRPNIIADPGVQVQVQLGSQMKLGDAVSWTAEQPFTVGTTRDLCFRVNGRYLSWRVSSSGSDPWKLESLDFDVKMGAMW